MLNTLIKLLSLEEFKESKKEDYCTSSFKETADGYSYMIYGGSRIYCNWQEEYENYCKQRQDYIEKTTPLYNFLQQTTDKCYSLAEFRQELNDNTTKNSTMLGLIKNKIAKKVEAHIINEKGQHIVFMKYQINQTDKAN